MRVILALFLFAVVVVADKCTTARDFSPRQDALAQYDYVIVGGGTAGAIVASRLAEDLSVKVLLIEQGGDLQDPTLNDKLLKELFDVAYCDPIVYPIINGTCPLDGTNVPFHLSNTPLAVPWVVNTDAMQHFYVGPHRYAENKEFKYVRGGVLGGSSATNWMIAPRGTPYDFDTVWKREGVVGWNYSEVLPYFRKLETADGKTVPQDEYHGSSGPYCMTMPNSHHPSPMWDAMLASAKALGIPETKDFSNPNSFYGIGQQASTVCPDGRRSSSRNYITRLQAKGQVCFGSYETCPAAANLHILLWSTVVQVDFDTEAKPPRAVGVRYVSSKTNPYVAKSYHPNHPMTASEATKFRTDWDMWNPAERPDPLGTYGTLAGSYTTDQLKWRIRPEDPTLISNAKVVTVRREVIMAAGNFITPQLLMLSGVGPARELEALKINVIADLPVGKGVEDHDEFLMLFSHNDPSNMYWDVANLFTHVGEWVQSLPSPIASNHALGSLDISIDGVIPETHSTYGAFYIEDLDNSRWRVHTPDMIVPRSIPSLFSWKGLQASGWLIATAHRCAKGSVALKNRNPLQTPFVDLNIGACQKTLDEIVFAVRKLRQIMGGLTGKFAVTEIFPGPAVTSTEDLEHFIREALWGHQTCCSSPMGPCSKPQSVADDEGRVFLVSGLRIVDISIFPTEPLGNTMLTTAMVAEKLSDSIKAQYSGVHGHLFNDLNGDGVQSDGEDNLMNVTVTLTECSNQSLVGLQTKTNNLGQWRLNVTEKGTVSYTLPSGWKPVSYWAASPATPTSTSFGASGWTRSIGVTSSPSNGLSGGAIAAIVICSLLGAAIVVLLVVLLIRGLNLKSANGNTHTLGRAGVGL